MENLRDQIFQATKNFLVTIQQLTEQHAALVLQETFSSLGGGAKRPRAAGPRPRGAKRGSDELEQLSSRFVQFVHDNPGLRIEQINKQLGTTTTELALPIRKLITEKKITTKGQKRSTTYFADKDAAAAAPSEDESEGEGEGASENKAPSKGRKKSSRSKKSRSKSKSKK